MLKRFSLNFRLLASLILLNFILLEPSKATLPDPMPEELLETVEVQITP